MMKRKFYAMTVFEISILLIAIVAFSYLLSDSIGIVSATDTFNTCASTCTEYSASECGSHCAESCVPSTISGVAECEPGLCFDPNEGTCQQDAPKRLCENHGGVWSDNPNMQQCKKGCCIVEDEAFLTTDTQCTTLSSQLGETKNFKTEANTMLKCMVYSNTKEEGACLTSKNTLTGKRNCQFETKDKCTSKGEFYGGFLCSNPDLNTTCEKQKTSKCVENKDEIYWFDSCGNRENIYDANKVKSWNAGRVLSKNESCSLGSGNNPISNQEKCGNCDYFAGSKCGNKTETQKLDDPLQKNVCRDLSCVDENGQRREHGESWCAYQGAIGVVGKNQRSVDTPGSRDFREVCFEGEIRLEPCADWRSEICVENQSSGQSSSKCITNMWTNCIEANKKQGAARTAACKEYTAFCFMKPVDVANHFKFSVCVPKYPPGYNLTSGKNGSCALGTQTCKITYVKDYDLKWKCKDNCDCKDNAFTTQMNDLCMSLGDCGAKVNYEGNLTKNYKVSGAGALSSSYLNGIKQYSEIIPGKYATGEGIVGLLQGSGESCANCGDEDYYAPFWESGIGVIGTFLNIGTIFGWATLISDFMVSVLGISQSNFFVKVADLLNPFKWFGVGDTKTKKVKFTCMQWAPPAGGKDCEKCGKDGFPCTDYACSSLGRTCKLINQDTGNERCIDFNPYGTSVPTISPWEKSLEEEFQFGNSTATGVSIESIKEDRCIPSYTILNVGISTNMPSRCKYSTKANFNYTDGTEEILVDNYANDNEINKEIDEDFFGDSLFTENHSKKFMMPSMENLGLSSHNPNARADYNLYVKCESPNGNINAANYNIKLCVRPGMDIMPPNIMYVQPSSGLVKFGADNKNISVYTDEPADCKWGLSDVIYNSMRNNFTCTNDPADETILGWKCDANLPMATNNATFYIRCKDQPWETNETKRNPMTSGYPLKLTVTPELKITSATPDNEKLVFGVVPVTVTIEVETEGGANKAADCYYSLGDGYYHPFNEDGAQTHKNTFNSIMDGMASFEIKCTDAAENEVYQNISFDVETDTASPKIARIYQDMGDLIIKTSEEAECAISMDTCGFNFENATKMTGSEYYHSVPIAIKSIYYIMCKDKFGNYGGSCDLKIKTI
jgi:hypothetical protein